MAKNVANICDQISHKSGHAERGCRIIQFKMGRSLSSFSLISTFLQTVNTKNMFDKRADDWIRTRGLLWGSEVTTQSTVRQPLSYELYCWLSVLNHVFSLRIFL